MGRGFGRNERSVAPQRLAVAPPIKPEGPAWQRLAGIPFALAVMQEPSRRKALPQAANELVGTRALARTEGDGVPFRRLAVIDRDKGRLAPHGQGHIVARESAIDLFAHGVERAPCRL